MLSKLYQVSFKKNYPNKRQSDKMVYQKRKSVTQSSTDSGYYTPCHGYNTRLSSAISQSNSNLRLRQRIDNEDAYLLNENFDRISESSYYLHNSSDILLEYNNYNLVKFPMEFDVPLPLCPRINDRCKWIKWGCIVLVIAVIGWFVNNVRLAFNKMQDELELSNGRIGDIVDSRLDMLNALSEMNSQIKDLKQSQVNFKQTVSKLVEHEIIKMYSDKTGKTDFALESAGGRVVRLSQGTENYVQAKSSLLGIGIPFCDGMHGPRSMIQTGTSPGECWAFKGSNGGVVIKLLGSIKIDAVSLEHIPKTISPSGDSTTAPKDFSAWGMKSLTDKGMLLGQFSYKVDGPMVQTFSVTNPINDVYDFVELNIQSNHGNEDFTCVYRFRVHGTMEKPKDK